MADQDQQSGTGQADVTAYTSEFNKISFLVQQALALVAGATLVQVVKCTTNNQIGPVGFVDVQPLINLLDGAGTSSPHGVLYGLPYSRVSGGKNAVICDPGKGDIGLAVFADRDISAVKASLKQSNPGTFRRNSMSDGIYLFTVLSAQAPVQWVQFVQDSDGNPTGMTITDVNGNSIRMSASGISFIC